MRRVVTMAVLCLVVVLASATLSLAGESGYANVVTVSPTGADYTTVSAAVNSITDASETNRYLVKVYPGTYSGRVDCKEYVDIVGAGRNSVILTHNGTSSGGFPPTDPATLRVCKNLYVANLTVKATASTGIAVNGGGPDCLLSNLNVIAETMGVGIGGGSGTPDLPCRDCVDRFATIRDSNVRAKVQAAQFGDGSAAYGCTFTVDTEGSANSILGVEIMGNTVIRDCQVKVSISGTAPSDVGGIWNNDVATPTRIERTSVHVSAGSASASFPVYGIKSGIIDDYIGATTDIDHCSIVVSNGGSGTTYDLVNGANDPECRDTTTVFATKYNTSRTYGTISVADGN